MFEYLLNFKVEATFSQKHEFIVWISKMNPLNSAIKIIYNDPIN